jgi:hypothetical protein
MWRGYKKELYLKLKNKTWKTHPYHTRTITDSENKLQINRYDSFGIAGSLYCTYELVDLTHKETIIKYEYSDNLVSILNHGLYNPLSKIIDPLYTSLRGVKLPAGKTGALFKNKRPLVKECLKLRPMFGKEGIL